MTALHLPGEDDYSSEDEEASLETEPCPCLFCKTVQSSAMSTLDHCRTAHNVDLIYISTQLGIVIHLKIVHSFECLLQHVTTILALN